MNASANFTAGRLPIDDDDIKFNEPWQAQAFSLTVELHKAGHFSWPDWVRIFSDEIKAVPASASESAGDAYYRQWAVALEKMVASCGLATNAEIRRRTEEWRQAYLNTPHGHPVELENSACPPPHDHHHHHHSPTRSPVAISLSQAR